MVLPLPSALTSFNQIATRAVEALDAIQGAIPTATQTVEKNVSKAVEGSITSEPGSIFSAVPGFVSDAAGSFLGNFAGPKSLSLTQQNTALNNIFGSGATVGSAVEEFVGANVKLEDILPAQQLYKIAQNLNSSSFYSDPIQAYTQVNSATNDIRNLCLEATDIINDLNTQLTNLLSVQSTMDYNQIQAANKEFFGESATKVNRSIELLNVVNDTFNSRGRYDAKEVADFCSALDSFTDFVMFANSKFLQFEILRKSIFEALDRLEAILSQIVEIILDVSEFVPTYITATAIGKIFKAVQGAVLSQSGIDLAKVLDLATQLSGLSTDDRTKHLAVFSMVSAVQAIKGYICKLKPSEDVQGEVVVSDEIVTSVTLLLGPVVAGPYNLAHQNVKSGTFEAHAGTIAGPLLTDGVDYTLDLVGGIITLTASGAALVNATPPQRLHAKYTYTASSEFIPYNFEYENLKTALGVAGLDTVFGDFQTQKSNYEKVANTAFIRDNTSDFNAATVALTAVLLTANGALTGICTAAGVYETFFATQTAANPDRNVGPLDLFEQVGADHARNVAKSKSLGDTSDLPLSEATSVGQLAESVKTRVDELPPGNEKDQLTLIHSDLQARHRATVVSMDFQRRKNVDTFLATDRAAEEQELINKTIETFSGLDDDQFDPVLLP